MTTKHHIQSRRKNDEILIELAGELGVASCEEARTQLQQSVHEDITRVYLHVEKLEYLDSAGLGILMGVHVTCRKRNQKLMLLAPHVNLGRMLKMCRLDQVLDICDREAAQKITATFDDCNAAVPE